MIDLRPVGYVIGLLVATLGVAMLFPMGVDLAARNGHWDVFAQASTVCLLAGGLMAGACRNGVSAGLTLRQTFLLTSLTGMSSAK